jgi:hypothetical protein
MPIIANTSPAAVRAANQLLSMTFFPRARKWFFPRLSASSVSTSKVEPYVAIGSVPMLQKYDGRLFTRKIPSYRQSVPNLLFKNAIEIDRSELEFDQTKSLARLAPALGVRIAEWPDYLWFKRLLKGGVSGSQTVVFEGESYTMTFDNKPLFSTTHATTYDASAQSNFIQGTVPATRALVIAQDIAVTANQLVRDLQAIINAVQTVKDTSGLPLFPNLDPKEALVVLVPPILLPAATLAFKTNGVIGGTNGSSSGATSNVAPVFVKDVLSSGLLNGFPDPEIDGTQTAVSPINETDWYVFIDDDFVKPFYVQTYRPPADSEMFPRGYDPAAVVDRLLSANSELTAQQAAVFASTAIETTFNKVGANADRATIESESFLAATRLRGNITYGPWFLSWKVIPAAGVVG